MFTICKSFKIRKIRNWVMKKRIPFLSAIPFALPCFSSVCLPDSSARERCVNYCDDAYKPTVRIMTCLQHLHFLQRVVLVFLCWTLNNPSNSNLKSGHVFQMKPHSILTTIPDKLAAMGPLNWLNWLISKFYSCSRSGPLSKIQICVIDQQNQNWMLISFALCKKESWFDFMMLVAL